MSYINILNDVCYLYSIVLLDTMKKSDERALKTLVKTVEDSVDKYFKSRYFKEEVLT
jgi:hypothetical protein